MFPRLVETIPKGEVILQGRGVLASCGADRAGGFHIPQQRGPGNDLGFAGPLFYIVSEVLNDYQTWEDSWLSRVRHLVVLLSMSFALLL